MNNTVSKLKERIFHSDFLNKKDYIIMGILILIFTILVFFRLGNTYAPQTSYYMEPSNRDIILDFGEYTDVSSVSLFLSNLNTRKFTLSAYNEVTGAWESINADTKAESVFAWNKIDVYYRLRYLGIVSTDEACVINELVAQGPDGNIITPVNASDYPALFDEQSMFPEHNSYMDGTMFDEVYHGRTAFEFIHKLVAYETTHPHLGKIIIAVGIKLFGMTPFGWRFMTALFGIFMIPLMYLFAKRLFKKTYFAAAATILLSFDCMHYALSRISTIDIFAGFFILLMYYYLYRYFLNDMEYRRGKQALKDKFPPRQVYIPLALCGISMALGIATKWTGVYAGAGLAILFVWYTLTHYPRKQTLRLFVFCCVFFIVIPLIVYTLSFIPLVSNTEFSGLIDKTVKNTQYMFNYHSKLVAEHYYSSPFYEWPVIWMPLLYASNMVSDTAVSAISCMGNPAIWWVGIPCVICTFYNWIVKRDQKAGFLCIGYAAQYVPWMSISRITFIYHYFPSILFTFLMMVYVMELIIKKFKWGKKAVTIYLLIAVICFFIFFPVVSGLPVSKSYGEHLRLLKDWILVI